MKKTFYLIFISLALIGCNSPVQPKQVSTWKQEVEAIDQEIEKLSAQEEETRHNANELERESILYMRDDYGAYSKMIEQIEKDHQAIEEIDKKIQKLHENKQKILDAHNEQANT